jgi:predicted aconitase with swiveling domain
MQIITGRSLLAGDVEGQLVYTDEPLSFWGGFDARTGNIIDARHKLSGVNVRSQVLALPYARGSSTGSGLLLEGIREGTAPSAMILSKPDAILALGAIVARELYAKLMPIVLVSENDFAVLRSVHWVRIEASGAIFWE